MIQLTDDLVMTADDYCYIVGRPRQRADRTLGIRDPATYHTTAAQAVQAAIARTLRKGVSDGSITTLQQFVEEQEQLKAEIERLLTPLN